MGASLALAGVSGCFKKPDEKIVPYVQQQQEIVPGLPLFFASAMPFNGFAKGVLVESYEGRPTKIEGNDQHPQSLGGTDVFMQASVLNLYDPDRAAGVTRYADVSTWTTFQSELANALSDQKNARLRILTDTVTSPTLAAQLKELTQRYPNAKWHQYEPVNRDNILAGARLAFGRDVNTVYRFDKAKVVVTLDSNFFIDQPGSVRYALDFISARKVSKGHKEMNRLYAAEVTPTLTGSMSDHLLPMKPSRMEALARALAAEVVGGGAGGAASDVLKEPWQGAGGKTVGDWVRAVAADLKANPGASVVVPGEYQSPAVHALAHAMNDALKNAGQTVVYTDPIEADSGNQIDSLRQLTNDMAAGQVDVLLIIGTNPVYTAPADIGFAKALEKVKFKACLGMYEDETSVLCEWHLPQTHYLEEWGDLRAYDGTVSIIQPLIAPLYFGKSAIEVLALVLGDTDSGGHKLVRDYWMKTAPLASGSVNDFEDHWEEALEKGIIANTAAPNVQPTLRPEAANPPETPASNTGYEIVFRPDPTVWDGMFTNNGWMQELPKPLTALTWDNAAMMSPATADKLGLSDAMAEGRGPRSPVDVVTLTLNGRSVKAASWILPGQPDGVITFHLGYGRERCGRVGNKTGFNAYAIRDSKSLWQAGGLKIERADENYALFATHTHHSMQARTLTDQLNAPVISTPKSESGHGAQVEPGNAAEARKAESSQELMDRNLIRFATLEQYTANPKFPKDVEEGKGTRHPLELFETPYKYPEKGANDYPGYKWGMVIDLQSCIGCNACVLGCQSENNIPVVGKEEVGRGREMHWIRVDHYYTGDLDNPATFHQPVPCMQCETAPCELVCPVGATAHDMEGINVMIYNRCVGTRYCSNNCPYKVRRFNFLLYSDETQPTIKMQKNPQVTVRSRGVMEKCNYCLQRIVNTRITAEKDGNRRIRDGELMTACQQACPTRAISFGDLNDFYANDGKGSEVLQLQRDSLNYILLEDLTTKPRTSYLARVTNPNPAVPSQYRLEQPETPLEKTGTPEKEPAHS